LIFRKQNGPKDKCWGLSEGLFDNEQNQGAARMKPLIALAAVLISATPASADESHPERVTWSCPDGAIVRLEVSYDGPNADTDPYEETTTIRFESPPPKGFNFHFRSVGDDAPYKWDAWLNGEPCSKSLN
jgi:hypothetical protein